MVKPTSSSSSSPPPPPPPSSSSSTRKYTGVRKRKWGKWVSEIRLPNSRERIWLGSYDSAEKAARAFDAAQFCLRGHSAKFNFPHNPPIIPGGQTLNRSEIQAAAAQFANNYSNEEETVAAAVEQLAVVDNNESAGSPSPTNSLSVVSDGTVQWDLDNSNDVGSYFDPLTTMGSGNYDFGLYTGFPDYYATAPHSPVFNSHWNGGGVDGGDDGSNGGDNWDMADYQVSYLWNF